LRDRLVRQLLLFFTVLIERGKRCCFISCFCFILFPCSALDPFSQQNTNPLSAFSNNPTNIHSSASVHASLDNFSITGKSDIQYSILDSHNNTLNSINNPLTALKGLTSASQDPSLSTDLTVNNNLDPRYSASNPIIAAARPLSRPVAPGGVRSSRDIEQDLDEKANRDARTRYVTFWHFFHSDPF
jgi:hypothetical protein